MAARTFSFWLLPHGAANERFRTAIHDLAERFSTPEFEPHCTIYGGIHSEDEDDIVARCRRIASATPPLTLHMESTDMRDDRFHSLFVRLRTTDDLAALHRRADEVFDGGWEFEPHISLLYGELPREDKERAQRERDEDWTGRAEARHLALYDTTGDVREWREVVRLELSGTAQE